MYHFRHNARSLQFPYSINKKIERVQVQQYAFLLSEISITMGDGWQNIKSWIQNRILRISFDGEI